MLSSERRAALIEWAERGERLIVEDDFDAELRYDRGGVGALQGLAPERVAYIGSASKRLAPAHAARLDADAVLARLAADLGQGDRGPRLGGDRPARAARLHRPRRARPPPAADAPALRSAAARRCSRRSPRHLPEARVGDGAAGLYELVELPEEVDEAALLGAAAERGVGVEGLALHRFSPGGPPGLVLGFGNLPEPAIEQGVRLLAEALREACAS